MSNHNLRRPNRKIGTVVPSPISIDDTSRLTARVRNVARASPNLQEPQSLPQPQPQVQTQTQPQPQPQPQPPMKQRTSYVVNNLFHRYELAGQKLRVRKEAWPYLHGWTFDNIPPPNSGVVRVFTSSTFTDMQLERNTLMIHVFPRMKDFCRQYCLEFQVVDMRWGVTEEATDNHLGPFFCLREIEECQQHSVGPSFLMFLGQRYGWVPLPRTINYEEFEQIHNYMSTSIEFRKELKLLETWYCEDANSVPPYYLLQRISKVLPNYLKKEDTAAMKEAQGEWSEQSTRLQKALFFSVNALFQSGAFTAEQQKSYMISVTHMEALDGLLKAADPADHCLAYVRNLAGLNKNDLWVISPYVDMHGMRVDTRFQAQLNDLRQSILDALPDENKKAFDVPFDVYRSWKPEQYMESPYLRELVQDVSTKLMDLTRKAAAAQEQIPNELEDEILRHLRMSKRLTKHFLGRTEEIKQVLNYIFEDKKNRALVIRGPAGCGRTSMIAKVNACVLDELNSSDKFDLEKTHIVVRYLGTTSDSSTLTMFLQSVCVQILKLNISTFEVPSKLPTKMVELCELFVQLITFLKPTEKLIMLIDALENVDHETSNMISLQWIPRLLPPNVKLVLSMSSDATVSERRSSAFRRFVRLRSDLNECAVTLGALSHDDALELIKREMTLSRRTLTTEQWKVVKSYMKDGAVPLYVKLLHHIVRWCTSYDDFLTVHQLPPTISGCIDEILQRLEKGYGLIFVSHTLSYVTAANAGLSEVELEDILSLDDDVLNEIYEWHIPPIRRLPTMLLARMIPDLAGYLTKHSSGTTTVYKWYHSSVHDAVSERYLKNTDLKREMHSRLADYFLGTWAGKTKPFRYSAAQLKRFHLEDREYESDRLVCAQPFMFDYGGQNNQQRFNLRKITELPHNLIRANRLLDVLRLCFFNFDYLYSRVTTASVDAILDDIDDYPNYRSDPDLLVLWSSLKLSASALHSNPTMLGSHLLARLMPYYHGSANMHQLLTKCDSEGIKQCALVPVHHCMQTPGGALQNSLEAGSIASYGVCISDDGEYMYTGSNKLRIWSVDAGTMNQELKFAISGVVKALRMSPNGSYLAGFTSNGQVFLCNLSTLDVCEMPAIQQFVTTRATANEQVLDIGVTDRELFVWTNGAYCRYSIDGNTLVKAIELASKSGESSQTIVSVHDNSAADSNSDEKAEWFVIGSESQNVRVFAVGSVVGNTAQIKFKCHNVCLFNNALSKIYCGESASSANILIRPLGLGTVRALRNPEAAYALTLSKNEQYVVATARHGFHVWDTKDTVADPHIFLLPNTADMQNFVVPLNTAKQQLVVFSKNYTYLACAVKRYIVVYSLAKVSLVTTLDLHYERIVLLIENPKNDSFFSTSMDHTIKIWDFTFILSQQHPFTRMSRSVESLSVSESGFIAAVTKAEASMWNTNSGRLVKTIGDQGRGSFLTAALSPDGYFMITLQEQAVSVWNVASWTLRWFVQHDSGTVLNVRLLDGNRALQYKISGTQPAGELAFEVQRRRRQSVVSMGVNTTKQRVYKVECFTLEKHEVIFTVDYEHTTRFGFLDPCVTDDGSFLCLLANSNKQGVSGEEELNVFSVVTGKMAYTYPLRYAGKKEICSMCKVNSAPKLIALCDSEKATIVNVVSKAVVLSIMNWCTGISSCDGRFGVSLSGNAGLQTVDLKTGRPMQTLIARDSSTCALKMFTRLMYQDKYVLFYDSETRDIRVYRLKDNVLVAKQSMPALVNCVEVINQKVVVGLQDGGVVILILADADVHEMVDALKKLPSRHPHSKEFAVSLSTAFAAKKFQESLKKLQTAQH